MLNLSEFIKSLDLAAKNVLMYSESHPRTAQSVDQAYQILQEALHAKEGITISVVQGSLLVEGDQIPKGNALADRFCRDLASRNIRSLTFLKGISREELVKTFHLLNVKPQRVLDAGGFEKLVENEGLNNVQANKIRYGIVGEDGSAIASTDEMLLSQLVFALQSGASPNASMAQSIEKSFSVNPVQDPASIMYRAIQMMPAVSSTVPGEESETRKKFIQLFRSFTPQLQSKLLLTAVLKEASIQQPEIRGFYHELTPQEMEASLLLLLQQNAPGGPELIGKLLGENIKLSDTVRNQLNKLSGTKVIDLALAEELLKKETLTTSDIGKVSIAVEQLVEAGKLNEADSLSKKVFSYLNTGKAEEKIAAVQAIPAIGSALSKNEKWRNLSASLPLIVNNCFRKETNDQVLAAFLEFLLNSFRKTYEISNFGAWQSLLQTIHSRTEGNAFLVQALTDHLAEFRELFVLEIQNGTKGAETALEYLRLCGTSGVHFYLDLLVQEEDQRVRGRLISYIEQLDRKYLVPELERCMSDSRWYVVRNIVTIVNKLNVREASTMLQQAARNPDSRVAKEVLKKLMRSCSLSDAPVLLVLLENSDKSVTMQAMHLIGTISLDSAVPALLRLATSGSQADTDLRAAAFQTLLALKAKEAIEYARALLDRKASGKSEIAERNAAVKILGELSRENDLPLLARIAASDTNSETRAVAQMYL